MTQAIQTCVGAVLPCHALAQKHKHNTACLACSYVETSLIEHLTLTCLLPFHFLCARFLLTWLAWSCFELYLILCPFALCMLLLLFLCVCLLLTWLAGSRVLLTYGAAAARQDAPEWAHSLPDAACSWPQTWEQRCNPAELPLLPLASTSPTAAKLSHVSKGTIW